MFYVVDLKMALRYKSKRVLTICVSVKTVSSVRQNDFSNAVLVEWTFGEMF